MKDRHNNWLFIFIITLPIIDILTTFTIGWPVSFGAAVRPLIMAIALIWLISHTEINRYIIFIPFIWLASSFTLQLLTKKPFLFIDELQFYLKTAYYITVLLFAYFYELGTTIKLRTINKAIQIAALIIASSFWLAILTKTSLKSYSYDKSGFSAWFFAANELSVIVLITLSLTIVAYLDKKNTLSLLAVLATLSVAPMIGTKTALFGALILMFMTSALLIIKRSIKDWLAIVLLGMIFIILLPVTPALQNTSLITKEVYPEEETSSLLTTNETLLSSRDTYLADTSQIYGESSLINKWFGLGYAGFYNTDPKMIEMDFYDLFFSFGIAGTIILLYPLILVTLRVIQASSLTISYIILLGSYLLCLAIAFYVGHVLFAPAVMSYLAILLLRLKITLADMKRYE